MKFYLASSFDFIDKVDRIADTLEENGHTITEKWWKRPYQNESHGLVHTTDLKKIYEELSPKEFYKKPETRKTFALDFNAVKECDVFILIASDKPRKFNGANIELGIAIAYNKLLFSVGCLEKSALYYPVEQFNDIKEVILQLKELGYI